VPGIGFGGVGFGLDSISAAELVDVHVVLQAVPAISLAQWSAPAGSGQVNWFIPPSHSRQQVLMYWLNCSGGTSPVKRLEYTSKCVSFVNVARLRGIVPSSEFMDTSKKVNAVIQERLEGNGPFRLLVPKTSPVILNDPRVKVVESKVEPARVVLVLNAAAQAASVQSTATDIQE
jgi:hypothetical protein